MTEDIRSVERDIHRDRCMRKMGRYQTLFSNINKQRLAVNQSSTWKAMSMCKVMKLRN